MVRDLYLYPSRCHGWFWVGVVSMKKLLIDYIREKDECNYADIFDWFKDLSYSDDSFKANVFIELLLYICEQEEKEGSKHD